MFPAPLSPLPPVAKPLNDINGLSPCEYICMFLRVVADSYRQELRVRSQVKCKDGGACPCMCPDRCSFAGYMVKRSDASALHRCAEVWTCRIAAGRGSGIPFDVRRRWCRTCLWTVTRSSGELKTTRICDIVYKCKSGGDQGGSRAFLENFQFVCLRQSWLDIR